MGGELDASSPATRPRCIALQCSVAVRVATLGFALVAALALGSVVMPRSGAAAAVALAAASFGALWLAALAHERRQPAAIGIEPDGVVAYDRCGGVILRGRIAGCVQWADRLLMMAVLTHGGARALPLVIAADALPAEAYRELAVRARLGAR